MSISVLTASVPSRAMMLAECVASIAGQTLPPLEHLIAVDHARLGSSATRNALLGCARGEWVAVLDDDDLADPVHLERLNSADGDIVYTYCRVEGRSASFNQAFDEKALRDRNYIPITSLIRTDLLRSLGGWRDSAVCNSGLEDWDFWVRALDAGARFVCIPEVTWTYRWHAGNKTTVGEAAAR